MRPKNQTGLTKEEKIARITAMKIEIESRNPFWFFKPNDGKIDEWGYSILRRYLKEEDIPTSVDGQLDILLSKADIRGISGGNRAGKTLVSTIDGIIKSIGELPKSLESYRPHFEETIKIAKNKKIRGRVTAVDNKQLHRVVLEMWKRLVPHEYLKDGIWEKSYSREFDILTTYRNDKPCATIEFLTNEQDVRSSQGGDLDWAKFDEEPDRAKWKETLMRFGTSERLDVEIAWTPTEGLSWATSLFHHGIFDEQEDNNNRELFKLTSVGNPFVKDTIIRIMDEFQQVSSYDEMRMRLLGEAISLSGLIYGGLFNRQIHLIEPFEIDPYKYIVYRGLDPHLAKATVCVEMAIDKEGFEYVIGTYSKVADTEELKRDLHMRVKNNIYRLGRTVCDKSADADIQILKRNIYKELKTGKYAIPALITSEKFDGSIKAGVDQIKKLLKPDPNNLIPALRKPKLYIFNIPENKQLIHAFQTLERDTYKDEDKKGMKDRIAEGKHDAHACLRYIHQTRIIWLPYNEVKPQPGRERSYV